jgi:hypothetical protein
VLSVTLLGAGPATADDGLDDLVRWAAVGGSLRAGYWSASRDLDGREHLPTAALWLKAQPRLGRNATLVLDGWVMNQDLFREEATDGILREGYLALDLGAVDVRIGRQIIAWGRADRINPTDNLTPRDFTLPVPDDDDQRRGTASIRARAHRGSLSLTAVWLPEFIPDTVPIRPLGAGVHLRERRPGQPTGQWALKVEQTGTAVEWSVSYFDGFDLRPDLGVDRIEPSGPELLLRHHRIRVVGADAATTVGRFAFRGEVAYTRTEDVDGDDPSVKNPFVFLVLGVERTFRESLTVNVQYLLRYTVDHRSPFEIPDPLTRRVAIEAATISRELDPVQHGASLRVSRKWLHETLETEVVAVAGLTRLDYAIRPKVTYAFTDRLRGTLGADLFGGDRHSLFGYLRRASGAYAELRWSF